VSEAAKQTTLSVAQTPKTASQILAKTTASPINKTENVVSSKFINLGHENIHK